MSRCVPSTVVCLIAMVANVSVALALDAKQLTEEFSKNEAGFKQRYIGSTLEVTGPLFSVSLDPGRSGRASGPNIQLTGPYWRITCYLNNADRQRALSLSKGDQLTISGTFVSAGGVGLNFDPCTFR